VAAAIDRRRLAVVALAVAVALPASRIDSGPVVCPVRHVTGRPCPGCGLIRSVVKTVHGQPAAAWQDHPAGPLIVALLGVWAVTGARHHGTWADPQAWTATRARRAALTGVALTWSVWAVRRMLHAR